MRVPAQTLLALRHLRVVGRSKCRRYPALRKRHTNPTARPRGFRFCGRTYTSWRLNISSFSTLGHLEQPRQHTSRTATPAVTTRASRLPLAIIHSTKLCICGARFSAIPILQMRAWFRVLFCPTASTVPDQLRISVPPLSAEKTIASDNQSRPP